MSVESIVRPAATPPWGAVGGARPAGRRWMVLPPLVAFVLASGALALAGQLGGYYPLEVAAWHRFDSVHYVGIAEHGYQCAHNALPFAKRCYDAGWFPLYPAVVRAVGETGLPLAHSGLLVSLVFCFLGLLVLWWALLEVAPRRRALIGLAFGAFVPGVVYLHAIFPMSMASLFVLLFVLAATRERWAAAGLAGLLGAMTYPTVVLLAPVGVVWVLAQRAPWRERARRVVIVGGLTVLGLLAVLAYSQASTGHWDIYFKVQSSHSHGLHLPFRNLYELYRPVNIGPGGIERIIAVQAWLVTALILAVAGVTWRRRHTATRLDWLLVLVGVVFWLGPLTQNTVSYYRGDTLLLPLALAVARLPARLALLLTAGAVVVGGVMGLAFFEGVLT